MSAGAVFVRDGRGFEATELGLGPWYPGALHGGAPAALVMRALSEAGHDPSLHVARVTYEFVRAVPVGALSVEVQPVRAGRRSALYDLSIAGPEGVEVMRARALLLRPSELGPTDLSPPPFPGPQDGAPSQFPAAPGQRMFATDAVEIRFVEGSFFGLGPATAWFRLRVPLVAGEPTSGLERLAAVADFPNGISAEVSWEEHVFINAELTLYVGREPEGEWVALQARTELVAGGIARAEGALWDRRGPVGHALQALVVARR